ncbi:GntR family transcriptional regulator [Streptomyces coeruleofuscus]|uniref:HTH gntR-type domain-containing protein n=1 Tax=Streptomyces coeruleofuscus TaxID=66879 RepID=A0ABP5USY8_9ACTN
MAHKFEWQEQRTTTPDGVYRVLREAILDGTVPPGGQLREAHIAADLGISRSPLREALTRLEEDGLVVSSSCPPSTPSPCRSRSTTPSPSTSTPA